MSDHCSIGVVAGVTVLRMLACSVCAVALSAEQPLQQSRGTGPCFMMQYGSPEFLLVAQWEHSVHVHQADARLSILHLQ
jgi:hypothetical protein